MGKHFELTGETRINAFGVKLFQIRCTVAFGDVKVGDIGGWIEKEENLFGNAWVYGDAEVFGDACVFGDAKVSDRAKVYGNAKVYGDAEVYGNAMVSGNAMVAGNAEVSGNAEVFGNAWVYGNTWVYGDAKVSGNAMVLGDAKVSRNAMVLGDAKVSRNAEVNGNADYCCFQGFGSAFRTTTVFRTKDKELRIQCGCFFGTLDEFAAQVERTHGDNQHGKVYKAIIEVIKLRFVEK